MTAVEVRFDRALPLYQEHAVEVMHLLIDNERNANAAGGPHTVN